MIPRPGDCQRGLIRRLAGSAIAAMSGVFGAVTGGLSAAGERGAQAAGAEPSAPNVYRARVVV